MIMDFISQRFWKNDSGMANTDLTLVIVGIIYGLEKRDLFVRGSIVNLPPPCGEKLFSPVTVRKGEYGVNTR